MLITADHANQKVRCNPAGESREGVDLCALEVAAYGIAIEFRAAHNDLGKPVALRRRLRCLGRPGIAECGETIIDPAARTGRREEALYLVLFRDAALRLRIGVEIIGEAAAIGDERRGVAAEASIDRV